MRAVLVCGGAYVGRANRGWQAAHRCLRELGVDVDVRFAKGATHAARIAYESRSGPHSIVIALGGDSTISDVARGLRNSAMPLGIIPLDAMAQHARAHGIPRNDLAAACRIIAIPELSRDRLCGAMRVEAIPAAGRSLSPLPAPMDEINGVAVHAGRVVRWAFMHVAFGVNASATRLKSLGRYLGAVRTACGHLAKQPACVDGHVIPDAGKYKARSILGAELCG